MLLFGTWVHEFVVLYILHVGIYNLVETIRPAQGFPFNILILKAKIHKDTI